MAILVTFPGKFGDLLWALPTVREIAKRDEVDLGVMPRFSSIAALISSQPYVQDCYGILGWDMVHDQCGAQPMIPPQGRLLPKKYDQILVLGYKERPNLPLVQYIASQTDAALSFPVLPFIHEEEPPTINLVSYAFNGMHAALKGAMMDKLKELLPSVEFYDVSKCSWTDASKIIASSIFFIGCRNGLSVLAHGLRKRVLTIEPEEGRREHIFSCPYGREAMPRPDDLKSVLTICVRWLGWDMKVIEESAEKEGESASS